MRAGYRVVVSANNPIAAFILEVMASRLARKKSTKSTPAEILRRKVCCLKTKSTPTTSLTAEPDCREQEIKPKLLSLSSGRRTQPNPCSPSAPARAAANSQFPLPRRCSPPRTSAGVERAQSAFAELAGPGDPLRGLMAGDRFLPPPSSSLQAMLNRVDNLLSPRQRSCCGR